VFDSWSITVEAGPHRTAVVTRVVGQPPPGTVLVLSGQDGPDLESLAIARQLPGHARRQLAALAALDDCAAAS